MPTVREIGEDALVQRLTQSLRRDDRVVVGPGDDCAVVIAPHSHTQLLKVDAMVEGVHFTMDTDPRLIGRKALARPLSDMAAMGGVPEHALITLVLPPRTEAEWVEQLYRGMGSLAERYEVNLVGGETTRGHQVMISVALTGSTVDDEWITRSGARAGDVLLVTGALGGSIKRHHLTFEPRLREATWLIMNFKPTAMMDLSDGLAKDLPRLAAMSGVDYQVDLASLPCTAGCAPMDAWRDGEDYELLFTIEAERVAELQAAWKDSVGSPALTQIGRIVPTGTGDGAKMARGGWDGFQS